MANYQELLSKAVRALPENNGASRREVYEKARKALVAQLRAITPPLPAREITQHRLELEDCIRQVEHEATEALLGGLKNVDETSIPLTREPAGDEAALPEEAGRQGAGAQEVEQVEAQKVEAEKAQPGAGEPAGHEPVEGEAVQQPSDDQPGQAPLEQGEAAGDLAEAKVEDAGKTSPEEENVPEGEKAPNADEPPIVEQQADDAGRDVAADAGEAVAEEDESSALDEIIARAERDRNTKASADEAGSGNAGDGSSVSVDKMPGEVSGGTEVSPTEELSAAVMAQANGEPGVHGARTESDKGVGAAMSRVREVDNVPLSSVSAGVGELREETGAQGAGTQDFSANGAAIPAASDADGGVELSEAALKSRGSDAAVDDDAQLVVDRAIQTLDRAARGEVSQLEEDEESDAGRLSASELMSDEARFSSGDEDEKSSSGLTVFLVVVILLFGVVGGGGYWAWKEGYVDLEALFTSGEAMPGPDQAEDSPQQAASDGGDAPGADENANAGSGPGNTATDVENVDPTDPNVALGDPNKIEERLSSDTPPIRDVTGNVTGQPEGDGAKIEERLGADATTPDAALGQEGDVDPGTLGVGTAQSLLLEASTDGANGAVPFSGTVEWSRGVDELGEPTLIGKANIPARNLSVQVLIRRNADATLPASHLMEIDFDVSESFAGGAIAGLPGILLKNEELVQGTALIGASARVVGNSFLFALSASEQDVRANLDLLGNRRWMDLALIYASGRRAIITLEKDDAAEALFRDVLAAWAAAANGASDTPQTPPATEPAQEGSDNG